MYHVIPVVSAGSNYVGATETCRAQVKRLLGSLAYARAVRPAAQANPAARNRSRRLRRPTIGGWFSPVGSVALSGRSSCVNVVVPLRPRSHTLPCCARGMHVGRSVPPASLTQAIKHVLVVLSAEKWKASPNNPPQRLGRNCTSLLQCTARLSQPV
jgi:hypothetical protein